MQCVHVGDAKRAAEWAEEEQAGAVEKEKGGGVRLGHRAGQARKGKEEEGRANSLDWAENGRRVFQIQILFQFLVFKSKTNSNQIQV